MNKILVFSLDVYRDVHDKKDFMELINSFKNNGNRIIFTSQFNNRAEEIKKLGLDKFEYKIRDDIRKEVKERSDFSRYYIVIGNTDQDLYLAAQNKFFFILPMWCKKKEEKADKYGFKITKISGLKLLIDIVENQKSWFYRLEVDDKTTVLALTNANTKNRNQSKEEIEIVEQFRKVLKEGNKLYYNVLLCHFLASISNNKEFLEIQDWSIFPSSGEELNQDMVAFKERARCLMGGRKKENIFIRHTKTWQSKQARFLNKNRLPCDRHFDTIIINDRYKGKLKNRVVCVFDDYTTNGTSFEVARNILLKEGAKKIFLIALGKYHKNTENQYNIQNYTLKGPLNKKGYTYKSLNSKWETGKFDYKAVEEIENIYDFLHPKVST
ncbi:phosphoribosyltransferase [Clostridium thermobutyricum]|uniref:phosphoribosyltransferase n=1 Tax=Clostridium thermobutyricum TaxID=29372 RepID=UPI002942C31F|nr:phosphoribosyltransferase [Clostridium thermobutyricum]